MSSKKTLYIGKESLACCFGGGSSLRLQRQLSSAGYGRLSTTEEGEPEQNCKSGPAPGSEPPASAQLGGIHTSTQKKHSARRRRRPVSINCIVGNAKECLKARAKEACEQVLEAAKKGAPHFNELFVGNKLLMQITVVELLHRRGVAYLARLRSLVYRQGVAYLARYVELRLQKLVMLNNTVGKHTGKRALSH